MGLERDPERPQWLATLRPFMRQREAVEQCELCSAALAPTHQHLIEPATRQIVCSCDACAILFSGDATTRYRRIPRRVQYLPEFQLSDEQWAGLLIPIQIAFFFHSSTANRVIALYPSPAGAIESSLSLTEWDTIVADNPVLRLLERDVEALLVNRTGATRDYYHAPIDECFKLVGLIRTYWAGLSGGTEVWRELGTYFDSLKERSYA